FLPPSSRASSTSASQDVETVAQEQVAQDSVAQSSPAGLQITPDGKRTHVSKDVNGERWAITRNSEDGTVTGNVFTSDGGDPKFIWCDPISGGGTSNPAALVTYSCEGADRCSAAPCSPDQWSFIAQVTLPESFFLP